MSKGWIKLQRKLLDWEWYSDINTSRLFVHLLLTANHKDKNWRGILIEKGSRLTSQFKLIDETGLSRQQLRSSLDRLKSTNDITIKTSAQHTVIYINNWVMYQEDNQEDNQQPTNEQPASNQRATTNKNVKNVKNVIKDTRFTPPTLEEVISYCRERQNSVEANNFINHYEANGWMRGKNKIKDWKACVRTWEQKEVKQVQTIQTRKTMPKAGTEE